ncbi:transglycosylase SLT domain-containing protein [Myxococcota bacterium]|nr:transglycosylase SLT domain-containing protein [Myxococcota bacterium]
MIPTLSILLTLVIHPAPQLSPVESFELKKERMALKQAQQILQNEEESEEKKAARLVKVATLHHQERWRELLETLEEIRRLGPNLGVYESLLRAQAASRLNQCEKAAEAVSLIPDHSTFAFTALWGASNCFLRAKEWDSFEKTHTRMTSIAQTDEQHATLLLLKGRSTRHLDTKEHKKDAKECFQKIIREYQGTKSVALAQKELIKMGKRLPRKLKTHPQDLIKDAQRAHKRMRRSKARRLYVQVLNLPTTKKNKPWHLVAHLGLVELDMVNKHYRRALKRLAKIRRARPTPQTEAHAIYLEADILGRQGRIGAALKSAEEATDRFSAEPFGVQAILDGAWLSYHTNRAQKSEEFARSTLAALSKARTIHIVGGDGAYETVGDPEEMAAEAHWILGWLSKKNGDPPAAMQSHLQQITSTSTLYPAALYWLSRISPEEKAAGYVHELNTVAPTSFYAAARPIELPPKTETPQEASSTLKTEVPSQNKIPWKSVRDLRGALTFFEYGMKREALSIVRKIRVTSLPPTERVAAGWLYRQSGDTWRGLIVSRRAAESIDADKANHPALIDTAYPIAFEKEVRKAAARHQVPAPLIFAIIRQESAFNPVAISPRQARGLMQMIRPTAYRMAKEARLRRFRLRDLYKPEMSINLGALYISLLLKEFDNQVVPAFDAPLLQ